MIISLEKAREFESLVKRVLMSKYGKMLPSDKITLLNTTEFLDESIIKADPSNVYGEVIRKVVGSVIDVTCTKELYISEELSKMGYDIDKKKIMIDDEINSLGTHIVTINLHKQVSFGMDIVLTK